MDLQQHLLSTVVTSREHLEIYESKYSHGRVVANVKNQTQSWAILRGLNKQTDGQTDGQMDRQTTSFYHYT